MTGPTAAAQPVPAVYGGIRYAGELVRAAAWEPSLGSALDGDVYFRVVFLESPPAPPAGDLRDGRIAVHVPGPPSPARRRAESELRTLREAQAGYAAEVGDTLAAQAHEIEEQVVDEWASSFRDGHVVASPPVEIDAGAVFASGYWSAWAERIGQALLARAYPTLPVDAAKLGTPLRPGEDAPALFEAVRAEGSAIGSVALDAFGTALGIARTGGGGSLDLSRCAGADLVAAEAEHHSGAALGHRLAHGLGLTYPMATLFALLSVLRGSTEVRLAPAHHLKLRGGAALDPARITADVVGDLAWPTRLWPDVDGIGPAGAPDAEGTGAYLDVLGLTDDSGLRAWLGTMSDGLLSVTQHLMALAAAQGRELGAGELGALGRVRRLIEASDAADVGARAREAFGGVGPFRAGMELWTAWRDGLEHAVALTGAIALVERATVEEGRRELSMERDALVSRLRDPALLTSPQQWPALAEAARRFLGAYADAYVEHHDAYHLQMELLAHRMAEADTQARALARLNAVPELGRPIAPELPGLCEELRSLVRTCGAALDRDAIAGAAVCPSCALRLDAVPPTAEVEALAASVNEALSEQNARLAKAVAHRLLKRDANERLDRFVQVVEVSDLSGLANVLDDELVAFLGALLREERG